MKKANRIILQTLVNDLWDSHLSNGKVKLALQRAAPKWPLKTHKVDLTQPTELLESPIEYAQHPLPNDDYVELIRSTDIGLLFYNCLLYTSPSPRD